MIVLQTPKGLSKRSESVLDFQKDFFGIVRLKDKVSHKSYLILRSVKSILLVVESPLT